jgi:hypothetical protein
MSENESNPTYVVRGVLADRTAVLNAVDASEARIFVDHLWLYGFSVRVSLKKPNGDELPFGKW